MPSAQYYIVFQREAPPLDFSLLRTVANYSLNPTANGTAPHRDADANLTAADGPALAPTPRRQRPEAFAPQVLQSAPGQIVVRFANAPLSAILGNRSELNRPQLYRPWLHRPSSHRLCLRRP